MFNGIISLLLVIGSLFKTAYGETDWQKQSTTSGR